MDKFDVLSSYYGYDSFRGNQEEIIDSLINKRNVIAVMATGGGKSICFQIPAILSSGITLVITPLISLMQNQVDELKKRKIAAEYISSEMDYIGINNVIERVKSNKIKLLYISPERVENERYCAIFSSLDISYLVIDEAHCISVWGNDFRPSYQAIVNLINNLKTKPTIGAFTATANTKVISDIERILKLDDYDIYKSGFDRKNLFYSVVQTKYKDSFLIKFLLSHTEEVGVIYTLTRKDCSSVYTRLKSYGFSVGIYHGAMEASEKEKSLNDFMNENIKIMVATNAFGMGINKPNIRYVINYSLPMSMEDLSQQSGRCSRDGEEGLCYLLFDPDDIKSCEYFIKETKAKPKEFQKELIKEKYKQLKSVVDYATTNKCLHQKMVSYFGGSAKNKCFMCVNCIKRRKKTQ